MNNIKINQLEQRLINSTFNKDKKQENVSFSKIFNNVQNKDDIKFSKHAKKRLVDRNINIKPLDIKKLNIAFEKAENKGINDALIIFDKNVFIANIENKTIITALENKYLNERVFTNIDGAVII